MSAPKIGQGAANGVEIGPKQSPECQKMSSSEIATENCRVSSGFADLPSSVVRTVRNGTTTVSVKNAFFTKIIGFPGDSKNSHQRWMQMNSSEPVLQFNGSGKAGVRKIQCQPFSKISSESCVNIRFGQSEKLSCTLTGDDNLLDQVSVEWIDGVLIASIKPGDYQFNLPLEIVVTGPNLKQVNVSGASDVELGGLSGQELTVHSSGTSTVRANGMVKRLSVEISGSSDFKAKRLIANEAHIKVSGNGDLSCFVIDDCSVSVSGRGEVTVLGNPQKRSVNVTWAGDVKFK